ncbi:MAG: hypothetical protein HYY84_01920, partial [Deltaproteobacteria bacterium]|nr:hypothetical protein [Deltaproteobacteria bacterium]
GAAGGCPTLGQQACANSLICADTTNCKTTCAADGDCVTGYCLSDTCVGKRLNGAAADRPTQCASGYLVDNTCCADSSCGAGTCATPTGTCATRNGQVCNAGSECASGTCAKRAGQVTGVCCATACNGKCMACDLAGSAGTCAPILAGTSDAACSAGAAACLTGACDGAGACARKAAGSVCQAASCNETLLTPAATCGATGGCPSISPQSCANSLKCENATSCKLTCSVDDDCANGTYCNGGTCTTPRALGGSCSRDTQCSSNHCVDGTCCTVSSCGAQTCATATGTCATRTGQACSLSSECASGTCARRAGQATGVCCATACSGTCMACDVAGSVGTCAPIPSGENNTACSAGAAACLTGACDGAGGCARIAPGAECRGSTCANGNRYTPAATCSVVGGCPATQEQVCANSLTCADTTTCKSTCNASSVPSDCVDGTYCAGGACVNVKELGQACSVGVECRSENCKDGTCCSSSQCASNETCATPSGVCLKKGGVAVLEAADCASGIRTDGVCCSVSACGTCRACNVIAAGQAGAGSCANVGSGQTHGSDCPGGDAACLTGACDGTGACERRGTGYVCLAETCVDPNTHTARQTCGTSGACPTTTPTACAGDLVCANGTSCKSTCSMNSDCRTGYRCSGNSCVPLTATGLACGGGIECVSGKCIDGVCCASDCNTPCRACNVPGNEGTCVNVLAGTAHGSDCGTDPASQCLAGTCNGVGGCERMSTGSQCAPSTCGGANSFTASRLCGATGACPVAGAATACGGSLKCENAVSCRVICAVDGDCMSGNYCDTGGGTCIAKKAPGQACGGAYQCAAGYCTDGVCCGSQTCGTCQMCNLNGLGTCSYVATGQDPRADCAIPGGNATCGVGWCSGAGACAYPGTETRCSDGLACSVNDTCDGLGFCTGSSSSWLSPRPFNGTMRAVFAASASVIFFVGDRGQIWRHDGANAWTQMDSGTRSDLFAVWGSSAMNIYAVGAGGVILKYDGNSGNQWSVMANPVSIQLNGVHGSSTGSTVYAVGNNGVVLKYSAGSWQNGSPTAALPELPNLNAVWTNGSVVMVGGRDAAAWKGASGDVDPACRLTWCRKNVVGSGLTMSVSALAGFSSTDIVASGYRSGGSGRTLQRWNGTSWSELNCGASPCSSNYDSIMPINSTDLWLSNSAALARWTSGTLTSQNIPNSQQSTKGSRIPGGPTIYLAGTHNFRHDGTSTFTELTSDMGMLPDGNAYPLFHRAAAAASASDIYTVSVRSYNNTVQIRRFDGSSWSVLLPPLSTQWRAVYRAGASAVYFAGDNGTIVFYNPSVSPATWTVVPPVTAASLKSIHGSSPTNIYAAGENTLLKFDGNAWTVQTFASGSGPNDIHSVFVLDATHVYLAAENGLWFLTPTGNWSAFPLSGAWGRVWAASATDIYALSLPMAEPDGRRGLGFSVEHFDGVEWRGAGLRSGQIFGTTGTDDLWGVDASHIYVSTSVLSGGSVIRYDILRFDGARWRRIAEIPVTTNGSDGWRASTLATTAAGDLFLVGRNVAVWKSATCDP